MGLLLKEEAAAATPPYYCDSSSSEPLLSVPSVEALTCRARATNTQARRSCLHLVPFPWFKRKILNVFQRCCLLSNLHDRGLFPALACTCRTSPVPQTRVCKVLRRCFVQ